MARMAGDGSERLLQAPEGAAEEVHDVRVDSRVGNLCRFCGGSSAPIAVILDPTFDDEDMSGANYAYACSDCASKSLLQLYQALDRDPQLDNG